MVRVALESARVVVVVVVAITVGRAHLAIRVLRAFTGAVLVIMGLAALTAQFA